MINAEMKGKRSDFAQNLVDAIDKKDFPKMGYENTGYDK